MRIDRIVLRLVKIPLKTQFENRWQRIHWWTKLIAEVQGDGSAGYGECTAMETPYYCHETIDTAWFAIKTWFADTLLNRAFEHPREVSAYFPRVSGHHEARATLECACWDLYARLQSLPLADAIGGRRRAVKAGATIGIQKDIDAVLEASQLAVSAGYERLKLKIKPGRDQELLAAVRSAFPQVTLLADANGAYCESDVPMLANLERLWPIILEQPFATAAWKTSTCLQTKTGAMVCLDESITCIEDVEQMVWLGAARLVNLRIGRVGGIANAIRIHDRCAEAGIPVYVGSKIETGIGRWMNVALGTLDNVRYPSDVSASERYFCDEIVRDPIVLVGPGLVEPLIDSGIGTRLDAEALVKYMVKTAALPS